ncbi:hypothetical protein B0H19DRAFT_1262943 [Mycena capillaripes]|nr:hypothetical protein B0H19DRAFT_1262943 [Mycena capillaripes]
MFILNVLLGLVLASLTPQTAAAVIVAHLSRSQASDKTISIIGIAALGTIYLVMAIFVLCVRQRRIAAETAVAEFRARPSHYVKQGPGRYDTFSSPGKAQDPAPEHPQDYVPQLGYRQPPRSNVSGAIKPPPAYPASLRVRDAEKHAGRPSAAGIIHLPRYYNPPPNAAPAPGGKIYRPPGPVAPGYNYATPIVLPAAYTTAQFGVFPTR